MPVPEPRLVMSPNEIRAFVRSHAESGVVESPTTGTHHGRRQIAQSYERWSAVFPDLDFKVENVIADHDQAAVFFAVSGTHRGSFLGLPATGKRIQFRGVLLQRFEQNELVYERRIHDFTGLLVRLGVLKVKPG